LEVGTELSDKALAPTPNENADRRDNVWNPAEYPVEIEIIIYGEESISTRRTMYWMS